MQSWQSVKITKAGHPNENQGGVVVSDGARPGEAGAQLVDVKIDATGQTETFDVSEVQAI
jgi:hypothetical protein